jgi:hypothetical protein
VEVPLKDELAKAELNPRDMIDVQSFMWCIRPDKATKSGKESSSTIGNLAHAHSLADISRFREFSKRGNVPKAGR